MNEPATEAADVETNGSGVDTSPSIDLESVRASAQAFQDQFQAAIEELAFDRAAITRLTGQANALADQLAAARQLADERAAEHAAMVQQHEEQLAELVAERDRLEGVAAERQAGIDAQAARVQALQADLERAEAQFEEQRAALAEMTAARDALADQLQSGQHELEELRRQSSSLQEVNDLQQNEIASLKATNAELIENRARLENLNSALQDTSASERSLHEKILAEKDAELHGLMTRLDDAAISANAAAAAPHAELEAEVAGLRSQLQELEALRANCAAEADRRQQSEADAAALESQLVQVREAAEQQVAVLSEREQQLASLTGELAEVTAERDALQANVDARVAPVVDADADAAVPDTHRVPDTGLSLLDENDATDAEIGAATDDAAETQVAGTLEADDGHMSGLELTLEPTPEPTAEPETGSVDQPGFDIEPAAGLDDDAGCVAAAGDPEPTETLHDEFAGAASGTSHDLEQPDEPLQPVDADAAAPGAQTDSMADDPEVNAEHRDMIDRLLARNHLRVYYQAIKALREDVSTHYEALVRVADDAVIQATPAEVFEMAVSGGRGSAIDRYVVARVLQNLADMPATDSRVFIKVTRATLGDADFPIWLMSTLREHGVQPDRIVIEVSEAVMQDDYESLQMLGKALQSIGCKLAIEHCRQLAGAQALAGLGATYLKIDGDLISKSAARGAEFETISAITRLAEELHMQTVAEAVEDPEALSILWEIGVSMVQGYFVHRPSVELECEIEPAGGAGEQGAAGRAVFD